MSKKQTALRIIEVSNRVKSAKLLYYAIDDYLTEFEKEIRLTSTRIPQEDKKLAKKIAKLRIKGHKISQEKIAYILNVSPSTISKILK